MNDARFWQKAQLDAYLKGVPHERMILLDLFTDVCVCVCVCVSVFVCTSVMCVCDDDDCFY